uniref:Uncharacterized protein n=1 Tax=Trichogramma kaykai TaxID=54128 RepID=A0ABD2X1B5_9HYME
MLPNICLDYFKTKCREIPDHGEVVLVSPTKLELYLTAQDGVKDEVNTSTTYCSGIVGTVDALAQLRLQLSALSCRADGERPADPQPVLPG